MRHQKDLVSIVMPARCRSEDRPRLVAAIDSVISQSWQLWELIVVDDGSPLPVEAALEEARIRDDRIRVLRGQASGVTRALIEGAAVARGEYLARLDADDVALPQRLAGQIARLRADSSLVLLGTWYEVQWSDGRRRAYEPPDSDRQLRRRLMYTNPFCHSSVMFRRAAYDAVGGYDISYDTSQDLALWFRLAAIGRLGMVEEMLTVRNMHAGAVSMGAKAKRQVSNGLRIRVSANGGSRRWYKRALAVPAAVCSAAYQYIRTVIAPEWR